MGVFSKKVTLHLRPDGAAGVSEVRAKVELQEEGLAHAKALRGKGPG